MHTGEDEAPLPPWSQYLCGRKEKEAKGALMDPKPENPKVPEGHLLDNAEG